MSETPTPYWVGNVAYLMFAGRPSMLDGPVFCVTYSSHPTADDKHLPLLVPQAERVGGVGHPTTRPHQLPLPLQASILNNELMLESPQRDR